MADKLAKATEQRLSATVVDASTKSFNMSQSYSYNGQTEHHFGVYYKAERKEGDPNTVILWVDPFVKMKDTSKNGASTYLRATNGEEIGILPNTYTYEFGSFLRWNTNSSIYSDGNYYYLFGSCADNLWRTDGQYWTSVEVSVDPTHNVCYYDFFYSNWLGKGNGIEHCYNTTSRGARYNRMRFEFEVPYGYIDNGPITTNSTYDKEQGRGTITWSQELGLNNGVTGYNLSIGTTKQSITSDYYTIKNNIVSGSYSYEDSDWGIQDSAGFQIILEDIPMQGTASQTATLSVRKWPQLSGKIDLIPLDSNGRLALNKKYTQTMNSQAVNAKVDNWQCFGTCSFSNQTISCDVEKITNASSWNLTLPKELSGHPGEVNLTIQMSDGYELWNQGYKIKAGSKIGFASSATELEGEREQELTVDLTKLQIDGKEIDTNAPEFAVVVTYYIYKEDGTLIASNTLSSTSKSEATIEVGALVGPSLAINEKHNLIIKLKASANNYLSAEQVKVAELNIGILDDQITTTLSTEDLVRIDNEANKVYASGPWFANKNSINPKVVNNTLKTKITSTNKIRYQYVFRAIGESTWKNIKGDKWSGETTGTQDISVTLNETFPDFSTGKAYELALLIQPINAPAYYKPFTWVIPDEKFTETKTQIASFLPKNFNKDKITNWDPSTIRLVGDNSTSSPTQPQITKCKLLYSNVSASAPSGATWQFATSIDTITGELTNQKELSETEYVQTEIQCQLSVDYDIRKEDRKIELTLTSGNPTSDTSQSQSFQLSSYDVTEGKSYTDYDSSIYYACVVYNKDTEAVILKDLIQTINFPVLKINYGSKPFFKTSTEITIERGNN